jgi:uncharacterized protein
MTAAVPSPCINICRMNPATGWCEGCLRTLDEIAAWGGLDEGRKRQVWTVLRERRMAVRQAAAAQADRPAAVAALAERASAVSPAVSPVAPPVVSPVVRP